MLNTDEVNNTIEELENSNTTFENCLKLASLYIVRENYKSANLTGNFNESEVVQELNDILPQYKHYCDVKRRYQLDEVTEQAVLNDMTEVCRELKEFIQVLYSNTDMPEERHLIVGTLNDIITKIA